MKRASGGKRSSKPKNPNKGRAFLNRPNPSNTVHSKSRPFVNRPASSNAVKPQKRLLTHCSESRLQNQSKGRYLINRLSPSKMVRPQNNLQNDLDGFMKLGGGNMDIKQERPEIPEATEQEELVAIDFDINGQTISAKMSSTMVQLLNEDEILREQIIEKLVMENAANPGEDIIITEPSISSDHELPDLNTSEPDTSNRAHANAVGEVNGQGSTKSKKRVRVGAPVGNRTVAPIVKQGFTPQDGIYSMWGDETVVTFLEAYEATKQQLRLKQPSTQHFWKTVCKQMKRKGYIRLTDKECQKKFESMEATYKEQVEQGITAQTATWEYFNTMKFLLDDNFKTTPLVPVTLPPKPIVDVTESPMYESDGASSSDEACLTSDDDDTNGLNFSDPTNEQPYKKEKISTSEETSEVELLRRTYLDVETKKLKEMKAMRKLQKQHSRLQAERNILLSSIVDLLRKNSIQVKKR